MKRLEEIIKTIPKCKLGAVVDEQSYLYELAKCAACLVSRRPGVGANFHPSKLLPALATGTLVLAVCKKSPLIEEIERSGFEIVLEPNNLSELQTVLNRWSTSTAEIKQLSENALVHSHNYNRRMYFRDTRTNCLQL